MKPDHLNATFSVINWQLASTVVPYLEELDTLLKENFDVDGSVVFLWTVQSMGKEEPSAEGGYRYSIVEVELGYKTPSGIFQQVAKTTFEHGEGGYAITDFSGFKNRQSLEEKRVAFFKKVSETFKERAHVPA